MNALILNATLKSSPEKSSAEALGRYVGEVLKSDHQVDFEIVRLVDHRIIPGVVSDALADDDAWPAVREKIVAADILILATPTWLGQPASVAKLALERMQGLMSETSEDGTPVAWNRVAGVIVVGNEDGAHHVISEIAGGLIDIGYTVPGQAWTYWNRGPGPSDEVYLTSDEVDWTHTTGAAMAHVLAHSARALASTPIPAQD